MTKILINMLTRPPNSTMAHLKISILTAAKRKLTWHGNITRSRDLAKSIIQGDVKGRRKTGKQRKVLLVNK